MVAVAWPALQYLPLCVAFWRFTFFRVLDGFPLFPSQRRGKKHVIFYLVQVGRDIRTGGTTGGLTHTHTHTGDMLLVVPPSLFLPGAATGKVGLLHSAMKRAGHTLAGKMSDSHLSHEPISECPRAEQNKGVKASFDRALVRARLLLPPPSFI